MGVTEKNESLAYYVVSFVRTNLPDITENYEEQAVCSDMEVFQLAIKRLGLEFSDKSLLGYSEEAAKYVGHQISAYFSTNNPSVFIEIAKNKNRIDSDLTFYAICLLGENKITELKMKLQKQLP